MFVKLKVVFFLKGRVMTRVVACLPAVLPTNSSIIKDHLMNLKLGINHDQYSFDICAQ